LPHPGGRATAQGGKITSYQSIILFRKFTADQIFTGFEMLPGQHVLICDPDGEIADLVSLADAGDDIESFPGTLSPGFINAHCHIELSHLKGKIPERQGLVNFVQQVMSGRESDAQTKQAAMIGAIRELYESGTVAIGDICNTTDSIPVKRNSPLRWHNFIEVSGFVEAGAIKRFEAAGEIRQQFMQELSTMPATLSPHAPYSVSGKLFSLLNEHTAGQLISIHNQEALAENELYKNKTGDFLRLYENMGIDIAGFSATGKTSLQSWLPTIDKGQTILSVHNTHTNAEDVAFVNSLTGSSISNYFFCSCINANLYIENTLPPLDMLMKQGANLVIGTDSYASNWQLNVFGELKSIRTHFPQITWTQCLQWATINGARALGMDDTLGSFERGKKPGIVLLSNEKATRVL
jgi:cytosine/adenosine deaminase-related metal-dependent hydrolase